MPPKKFQQQGEDVVAVEVVASNWTYQQKEDLEMQRTSRRMMQKKRKLTLIGSNLHEGCLGTKKKTGSIIVHVVNYCILNTLMKSSS